MLVIDGLPQLHGTQVYQGWLIHGKQPTSIGLLSMQNGVASVIYPGTIAGYQVAAVSREPGPTASKNVPAGPVVAAGDLKGPVVVVRYEPLKGVFVMEQSKQKVTTFLMFEVWLRRP